MSNEVQEVADQVSSMVNGSRSVGKEFVACMAREHRTLQQSFTGVCFEWIKHLASLKAGEYDMRNEAAVQACKKIMENHEYDLSLPYI